MSRGTRITFFKVSVVLNSGAHSSQPVHTRLLAVEGRSFGGTWRPGLLLPASERHSTFGGDPRAQWPSCASQGPGLNLCLSLLTEGAPSGQFPVPHTMAFLQQLICYDRVLWPLPLKIEKKAPKNFNDSISLRASFIRKMIDSHNIFQ